MQQVVPDRVFTIEDFLASDECARYVELTEGAGETRFYLRPPQGDVTVVPRRGMALLFRHHLLHEGATVTSGRKYVLRSDVMCSAHPRHG